MFLKSKVVVGQLVGFALPPPKTSPGERGDFGERGNLREGGVKSLSNSWGPLTVQKDSRSLGICMAWLRSGLYLRSFRRVMGPAYP